MKKFTILSTSVAFGAALILSGCGGSSTTSGDISISGEAMDPELSGSTVCLDLDRNRICDGSEPSTKTDEAGRYRLAITEEQHNEYHTLLVSGGTDIGTNKAFLGKLTAAKNIQQSVQNISPLTTMVESRYEYCQLHQQECQANTEEIKSKLAAHVELAEDEINANIVVLANNGQEEALKVALAFQKSAEMLNSSDPLVFYRLMATQGFENGKTWRNNISSVVATSPKASEINALIAMIMEVNVGDAHELAKKVEDEVVRINPIVPKRQVPDELDPIVPTNPLTR